MLRENALALSFVAQVTNAKRACAWIDVSNALSPESATASGIDLNGFSGFAAAYKLLRHDLAHVLESVND